MACIIIQEITEVIIGMTMILGFFSTKFAFLHKMRISLIIGCVFISAALVEAVLGIPTELAEFMAALLLLFIVEKVIATNLRKSFEWKYFAAVIGLTLISVLIKKDIKYFHIGTLTVMTIIPLKAWQNTPSFHWPYREVFYLSALFGFLAVGTYLASLHILSDFLYFGGVILFLSVIPELASTGTRQGF